MDDFFDQSENSMPRIGDQAPAFRAVTTQGTIYFPADYFGKWTILFSYSADLTPVTISEFITLASKYVDFKSVNCELVGLSVDGHSSHRARVRPNYGKNECKSTKAMEFEFPLIDDITVEVARKYGMIQPDKSNTTAVRAVFFVDPECIIRAIIYYPISIGFNFDELKRVIVALQTDNEAISFPAKSSGIIQKLVEAKNKKYNEWLFCTRELSEEKVVNVN